jgi:hypothetical protein
MFLNANLYAKDIVQKVLAQLGRSKLLDSILELAIEELNKKNYIQGKQILESILKKEHKYLLGKDSGDNRLVCMD